MLTTTYNIHKYKTIVFALIVMFILIGCNKNSEISTDEYFLKINVNGKEYETKNGGNVLMDVVNCDEKSGCLIQVGKIEDSEIYFDLYLNHYKYLIDFDPPIIDNKHFIGYFGRSASCEFGLEADFKDKINNDFEPVIMLDDNRNHIENVNRIDETETEIIYAVSGNFRCMYTYSAPTKTLVFGEYNVIISVLK